MIEKCELSEGAGRTEIRLTGYSLGDDIVICLGNSNAHLGAVAVAEYDHTENRVSTSVITRLGHKDDVLAQQAARLVSKSTKRPVCVIAGVHVPNITQDEIREIVANSDNLVQRFVRCSHQEPD